MKRPANSLSEIEYLADIGIVTPDGCRLSARVRRPANAAHHPVPAILEFLPHRKPDGTAARGALTQPGFAERGYACVRVDMRENDDSEGLMADEYTRQELDDSVEVIRWLADQPWCTGNVGVMVSSWGATMRSYSSRARDPAKLHLTRGEICLPVRPSGVGNECTFAPADAKKPQQVETLRGVGNARRIERDMKVGFTHPIIDDDFGLLEDSNHSLTSSDATQGRQSIHPGNPLSAKGFCRRAQEMNCDDIHLRTAASCEMRSDSDNLRLTASMHACENEVLVFSKQSEDTIPRNHL